MHGLSDATTPASLVDYVTGVYVPTAAAAVLRFTTPLPNGVTITVRNPTGTNDLKITSASGVTNVDTRPTGQMLAYDVEVVRVSWSSRGVGGDFQASATVTEGRMSSVGCP